MYFIKKIIKYRKLPMKEKRLFCEALLFVYAAKILLLTFPFKYVRSILSIRQISSDRTSLEELKQIKKAIYRTRWLSFWKNQCLVMSVASRWMLQRRNIHSQLSLGVAFDEDKKLKAHAWLKADEVDIVEKGGSYHELFCF